MADEKATAEAEEKEEKKKSEGFGIGKAILLSVGALLVFVLGIPLCLFFNGMLSASSPYLVPIEGNAMIDSLVAEVVAKRGDAEGTADSEAATQRVEAAVSEAVEKPVDDEAVVGSDMDLASAEPVENVLPEETNKTDETVERDETAGSDRPEDMETVGPPAPGAGPEGGVTQAEADAGEGPDEFTMDPERLKRLVKVYEKMRPKQVALILNTMQERQAVRILRGMKEKVAGKVFAEMEPKKVARMSQLLIRVNDNER